MRFRFDLLNPGGGNEDCKATAGSSTSSAAAVSASALDVPRIRNNFFDDAVLKIEWREFHRILEEPLIGVESQQRVVVVGVNYEHTNFFD